MVSYKKEAWYKDMLVGVVFLTISLVFLFKGFTFLLTLLTEDGQLIGGKAKDRGILMIFVLIEDGWLRYIAALILSFFAYIAISESIKKYNKRNFPDNSIFETKSDISFNKIITNAYPLDGELIVEFDFKELRSVVGSGTTQNIFYKVKPKNLNVFKFSKNRITWKNKKFLLAKELYLNSEIVSPEHLKNRLLTLGMRNQAPTKAHPTHHEYYIMLRPFDLDYPFFLCESIAGGHGERGGCIKLSMLELLSRNNWKEHFILSGCDWCLPIIEDQKTTKLLIKSILEEVRERGTSR